MSGIKHDQDKPDLSLVSRELVELLARVRMFGSEKYERDNWKKGFPVQRSCAAALRHIFAFLSGETNDPESGLSHLGHAVASLEHAIYDMSKGRNDDRGAAAPDDQQTHLNLHIKAGWVRNDSCQPLVFSCEYKSRGKTCDADADLYENEGLADSAFRCPRHVGK